MTTARDFIILALKEAGVTGVGQTPLDEDINDCFTLLNRMLAQWQKRRWIVPNLADVSAIANGAKSNLIGPGQYYNWPRPDKIQAAYFKQLTGGGGSNQVSYPLRPIWSYENYTNVALKELATWPTHFFYDAKFPYGNVFIWPIPDNSYEIHLICKGPIGFTTEIEDGVIKTAGDGYTDGNYISVPIVNLNSFGSGGTLDITVAGGIVTSAVINDGGDGYNIADTLTVDKASIGGTGAGFVWTVNDVTDDLNSEFNMPPEYEEAIHYNLCVRIVAHYQYEPNKVQGQLAKIALNTIKNANAQVPTLSMPNAYRFSNNNPFYIFNADQQ